MPFSTSMDTKGKKIYAFAKTKLLGKSERACERKTWSNIQASSVERRN